MYEFTVDWTSQMRPVLERIASQIAGDEMNILEIGAHEGRSTVMLYELFLRSRKGTITTVDVWQKEEHKNRWTSNRSQMPEPGRVYQVQSRSWDYFASIDETFDLILIDGSHQTIDVLGDLVSAARHIAKDGWIVVDDSDDPRVNRGLEAFLSTHADYIAVHRGYVTAIQWKAEAYPGESQTGTKIRRRSIMEESNWPIAWRSDDLSMYRSCVANCSEAEAYIRSKFSDRGWSLWGLSDGDIAWWAQHAMMSTRDNIDLRWLQCLADTSGLTSTDRLYLWHEFDRAVIETPVLMVQRNWEVAERFSLRALRSMGYDFDTGAYEGQSKRLIDCNAIYWMQDEILDYVRGQRVAVVSGHAKQMQTAIGCDLAIQCPSKWEHKAKRSVEIRQQLQSSEWDVLLCSAGGLSAILCADAARMGRVGIDIGSMDTKIV